MGCLVCRMDHGPRLRATKYKVGDRVALKVERRMPSEKFPGTFATKAEVDVGTVASARKYGVAEQREFGFLSRNPLKDYNRTEYHVKFAHGGEIRVDEQQLWEPSEEDEASARAVLARLGGDAAASDVRVET